MTDIQRALERVRERIAEAALKAGRRPSDITLVAVSKTFSAEAVLDAAAAGQRDFGENRVEEALPKMEEVKDLSLHWHLIGHVQSRKVKEAVGRFDLIHSVDSVKLAEAIDRRISNPQPPISNLQPQPILLECNISGEASKDGFIVSGWERDDDIFEAFARDVAHILALPNLRAQGLMTMAPIVDDPEQARPLFASLRALRDALEERATHAGQAAVSPCHLPHLSMGMTDDFEVAIAEGATLVRIGRAIFGAR